MTSAAYQNISAGGRARTLLAWTLHVAACLLGKEKSAKPEEICGDMPVVIILEGHLAGKWHREDGRKTARTIALAQAG